MRPSAEPIVQQLERIVGQQLAGEGTLPVDVTAALSGGIDSVVLLEVLRALSQRLGFRLNALHVNHGLSPNADHWENFCRAHCSRRRIVFRAIKVVVHGAGTNVEAEARAARYRAFAQHGSKIVVLGHNRDDQAETILLQLLRGAGIRGLSAMPTARLLRPQESDAGRVAAGPHPIILRPLLAVSRSDIERYAARKRLRWVEDESNSQERFARNFLRTQIMPSLEGRFPGCYVTLARSALHLAEAGQLLNHLAQIDGRGVVDGERLRVAGLKSLGHARSVNLLRYFLFSRDLALPATRHLDEILRQLCAERQDADPLLHLGQVCLRRFRGWIELAPLPQVDMQSTVVRWAGQGQLALPNGGQVRVRATRGQGVSAAKLTGGAVTIRWRRGGERMRLNSERPRRTLKNLLQEAGIPSWQRERMPLLYLNDELVWAPGIGVDSNFQAHRRERALEFSWIDLHLAPAVG
jgi:tRNA(Ile)-lysidine synthase